MAILNQGILGGGRNAVGTVVMTRWKGKDVIRARVSPSNPNTAAQQQTRALFSGLAAMATTLMDAFIRPYWKRYEAGTTAYNEWMRDNQALMRSALVPGTEAPGVFDPIKALLTRGGLAPAEVTGVADDGAGDTEVSFDGGAGDAADAVAVAVLRKADGSLKGAYAGFTRGDGSAVVPLPFADHAMYVFHVLAYRPGATPAQTALAVNSSIGFDDVGDPVIATAADRQTALAAKKKNGGDNPPPDGALV
jgi:hypothetical protein